MSSTISYESGPKKTVSSSKVIAESPDHDLALTVRTEQSDAQQPHDLPVCTICIETIVDNRYRLQCAHEFHRDCLKRSLASGHQKCPNCRAPIPRCTLITFRGCGQIMCQTLKCYFSCQMRSDVPASGQLVAVNCVLSVLYAVIYFFYELISFSVPPHSPVFPRQETDMAYNLGVIYLGAFFVVNPILSAFCRETHRYILQIQQGLR